MYAHIALFYSLKAKAMREAGVKPDRHTVEQGMGALLVSSLGYLNK